MPTRRQFLAGGVAASLAAGRLSSPCSAETDDPRCATPARPNFEMGVASFTFRKFSFDKCLAMTRRVGIKHICLKDVHLPLTSTPGQISEAVAKIKAAGLDPYGCGVIAMHKPAQVDRAFEYAKAIGSRVIVCMPSIEMLPRIDDKVREYDIRAAIHNHGPGDKIFPTPDAAYGRIRHLDRRVGLCMDIGHTIRIGGDPFRAARQYADRLLDVHMKDVTAASPAGVCVEAGRGVIDIPRFLRTLVATGYSGIVSFEYEKDEADPLPGLAESVGYVRGALQGGVR